MFGKFCVYFDCFKCSCTFPLKNKFALPHPQPQPFSKILEEMGKKPQVQSVTLSQSYAFNAFCRFLFQFDIIDPAVVIWSLNQFYSGTTQHLLFMQSEFLMYMTGNMSTLPACADRPVSIDLSLRHLLGVVFWMYANHSSFFFLGALIFLGSMIIGSY